MRWDGSRLLPRIGSRCQRWTGTLAILDACVLLPSRLSDVLFDLMLEGLYFAYWTSGVEAEFLRN